MNDEFRSALNFLSAYAGAAAVGIFCVAVLGTSYEVALFVGFVIGGIATLILHG